MQEILDDYRPDFSPGQWSPRDLHLKICNESLRDHLCLEEPAALNYRRAVFAGQPGVRFTL